MTIINRYKKYSVLLCLALMSLSCEEEFLHYRTEIPVIEQDSTFAIREMIGNQKLDIIWVIDNSGSMAPYQQKVIQNTSAFILPFSQNKFSLDWKMGLLSTDFNDSPYVGFGANDFLNPRVPSIVSKFQAAVGRLGTLGDGCERGFSPVTKALRANPGFLRKDSTLAFIFVTDAPEQSERTGFQCPAQPNIIYRTVPEFNRDLMQIHGTLKTVVSYGIFGSLDFGCSSANTGEEVWNYKGSRYEEFFKSVGVSKTYSLCKDDFGVALADIGKDLVKRVESPRIYLNQRPVADTIRVFYKSAELNSGPLAQGGVWAYDFQLNAIVFHDLSFAKEDNAAVDVQFDVDHSTD
jgi:hypothetical protein